MQILLPKKPGSGQPICKEWFDTFLQELTDAFGARDELSAGPRQGLWRRGGATEKDSIAVVEVMVECLDRRILGGHCASG